VAQILLNQSINQSINQSTLSFKKYLPGFYPVVFKKKVKQEVK